MKRPLQVSRLVRRLQISERWFCEVAFTGKQISEEVAD